MQASKGKANPKQVNELLRREIDILTHISGCMLDD